MSLEDRSALILGQVRELQEKYSGLDYVVDDGRSSVIRGVLAFTAKYNDISIEDEYEITITLPKDYPDTPPSAKETGGRIPKEFHLNPDGTLCLGVPLEVKTKFSEEPSLVGFVDNILIHFLYSHSHKQKYGTMPFGELSHGYQGILEYYQEVFNINDELAVVGLLRILADDDYRGHTSCPCGSNAKLRNCHGRQLLKLKQSQKPAEYLQECLGVANLLAEKGLNIPKSLIPKTFLRRINKSKKKRIKGAKK
jgi:ubiquitin-protein ligase